MVYILIITHYKRHPGQTLTKKCDLHSGKYDTQLLLALIRGEIHSFWQMFLISAYLEHFNKPVVVGLEILWLIDKLSPLHYTLYT